MEFSSFDNVQTVELAPNENSIGNGPLTESPVPPSTEHIPVVFLVDAEPLPMHNSTEENLNVIVRERCQNPRRKKKSRSRRRAKLLTQTDVKTTPIFEVVMTKIEKIKPILRAAKGICRRSRSLVLKRARFEESPKIVDITPRPNKIPGQIKMPESPPTTSDQQPVLTDITLEETTFFEGLPFTNEEKSVESVTTLTKVRNKRRSSTRLPNGPVIIDSSGEESEEVVEVSPVEASLSLNPVEGPASLHLARNRRRSFLAAQEKIATDFRPVKEERKSTMRIKRKLAMESNSNNEEEDVKLFAIFNKKTKLSPKKSPKKTQNEKPNRIKTSTKKSRIIETECKDKSSEDHVELIEVNDETEPEIIKRAPEPIRVEETWETTTKIFPTEKDFAPFLNLNHFSFVSDKNLDIDGNRHYLRFDDSYQPEQDSFSNVPCSSFSFLIESENNVQVPADVETEKSTETILCDNNDKSNNFTYGLFPFVEKYRPRTSRNFVAYDSSVVSRLKDWLQKWKRRLQSRNASFSIRSSPKKKRKKRSAESEEDSDFCDDDEDFNTAIIKGPCGVGKTCLVNCLAEELGFSVIEINASSRRSYKDVVASHIGATHSHRIDLTAPVSCSAPASPLLSSPRVDVSSKKDIRSFFCKQSSAPEIVSSPVEKNVDPIRNGKVDETKLGFAMSIILLDDVDVVFEEDDNFWNGVRDLTSQCRVPVILTSTEMNVLGVQVLTVGVDEYILSKNSTSACRTRLASICRQEGLPETSTSNENELGTCDLRKLTNCLQFWSNLNNESTLLSRMKEEIEMFRNSARLLDGLDEKPRRLGDLSSWRKEFAFVPAASTSTTSQLNCLRANLQSRAIACESELILDYLPYLRQCATISDQRSKERRKFRHYFHKIGLDDKWGNVQHVLREKLFK